MSAASKSENAILMTIANIIGSRLAAMLYTPQGKEIANQLWEETLVELSSTPIQESLKTFGN